MQIRLPVSLAIFFGSYLPLACILLVQDFDPKLAGQAACLNLTSTECGLPFRHPIWSVGMFLVTVACLGITLFALQLAKPKIPVEIQEVSYVPTDLMNYTLPYVVSFMNTDYDRSSQFVGMFIFLGWLFWLTHKAGQILLSPVLIAFGWRLYDIVYSFPGDQTKRTGRALAKSTIEAGNQARHVTVQDVMILG